MSERKFKDSYRNYTHLIDGIKCNACGGDGVDIDHVTHFWSCRFFTETKQMAITADDVRKRIAEIEERDENQPILFIRDGRVWFGCDFRYDEVQRVFNRLNKRYEVKHGK